MLIFTLLTETWTQQKYLYRKLNIYRPPVHFQVSHLTQYSVCARVDGSSQAVTVSVLLMCAEQLDSTCFCGWNGLPPSQTEAVTFASSGFCFSPLDCKTTRLLFHIPWCVYPTLFLQHSSYYAIATLYVLFINNLYSDRLWKENRSVVFQWKIIWEYV